jgi:nucleotide-binding universal stress UspA family protein
MPRRRAYMPLSTYPEAMPDAAILAAVALAQAMGLELVVEVLEVDIPHPVTPFGSVALDIPDLVRRAEDKSRAEAARLATVVAGAGVSSAGASGAGANGAGAGVMRTQVHFGTGEDRAAAAARQQDLVILPWSPATGRDLATALVFGAGRPVILVPTGAVAQPLDHLAVAWDGSRVAARAMWDALALLSEDGRVTVLTAAEDKGGADGAAMAAMLTRRGWRAEAVALPAAGRGVAAGLQAAAVAAGAQMLAMGGFGHSRLRDFVLGGVTTGILGDCRMPVLMSH